MPLVRISLPQGKPPAFRQAISRGVHQAMVDTINIPADDLFQVITEHPPEGLVIAPSYLGIAHGPDAILVQLTFRRGRTVEAKKALYARLTANLAADPGLGKNDVIIVLTENDPVDWSFGNGEAQYSP